MKISKVKTYYAGDGLFRYTMCMGNDVIESFDSYETQKGAEKAGNRVRDYLLGGDK